MNKVDLITAVAEQADMPKSAATQAVDTILAVIETALKSKQEVRLTGFGSFVTSERKATKGRNPRTGEEIDIPASVSVRFKPGKSLKDSLN